MGRIAFVVVLGLAMIGVPTWAAAQDRVEHVTFTVGPEPLDFDAGEACAFAVHGSSTDDVKQTIFFDAQGTPVRTVIHIEELNQVQNVESEYAIDERLHFTIHMNLVTGEHVETGTFWHVRDAGGRLLYAGAGRVVIDMATGEVLEATPNAGVVAGRDDFEQLIETNCALLAGQSVAR